MSLDSYKKRLYYGTIFANTFEKDENNKPKDVEEMIDDIEHLCNEFDKN